MGNFQGKDDVNKIDKPQNINQRVFKQKLFTCKSPSSCHFLPRSITYSYQHQTYVMSESYTNYVYFFKHPSHNSQSKIIEKYHNIQSLNYPRGLTTQPITNNLLVCDNHNMNVFCIDKLKQIQIQFTTTINNSQMDFKAGPTLKSTLLYKVNNYNPNPNSISSPNGVCCYIDGSIAISDTFFDRIRLFDSSGRFLSFFGCCGNKYNQFNCPDNLTYLPSQLSASPTLLVADRHNHRLSVWSISSNHHQSQPINQIPVSGSVKGVCVDLNGFVYTSCNRNFYSVVEKRDPRMGYKILQIIGNKWHFKSVSSMCVDENNNLAVVDCEDHSVYFF